MNNYLSEHCLESDFNQDTNLQRILLIPSIQVNCLKVVYLYSGAEL